MIHDFLLFLYFTASLNFQSKARQLIVEPIRQTVVRIVLWFEEIYMFNSMYVKHFVQTVNLRAQEQHII